MATLRLFLLHNVLFPRQSMQLVVFEPRYHRLVRDCLNEGEPFGIALIREGPEVGGPAVPHGVGTTARIQKAQRLPDGRLALHVLGEQRFRILATQTDQPYVTAEVDYPGDVEGAPIEPAMLERARRTYREVVRLRQAGSGEYEREIAAPATPAALAEAIGALQLGAAAQRQRILEADDACTRLQRATLLLERFSTAVRRESDRAIADRVRGSRLN